jgi:hypothetical protein
VIGHGKLREIDLLSFDHEHLADKSFSDHELVNLGAVGSRFERCSFERLSVRDTCFGAGAEMSFYTECSFDGSSLRGPAIGCARFERCSFRDVRLEEWFCFEAEFIDCVFSGAARGVVFDGAIPNRSAGGVPMRARLGRTVNEFRGNDFTEMDLRDVAFRTGIDLSRQHLPLGPDCVLILDAQSALERARAAVALWHDDAARKEAAILLNRWSEDVENGQRQLLIVPSSEAKYFDARTVERIVDLLGAD